MLEEKVIDYLKEQGAEIVYIFGSAARDELRDESDLDIAVVGRFDSMQFFEIKLWLENEISREVDLIDFNRVDTSFQAEIVSTGRSVYIKDEDVKGELEMKVLSLYLTLEEDRSPVIEEIKKRGSVFIWKE